MATILCLPTWMLSLSQKDLSAVLLVGVGQADPCVASRREFHNTAPFDILGFQPILDILSVELGTDMKRRHHDTLSHAFEDRPLGSR
jgi:hypothetical protein